MNCKYSFAEQFNGDMNGPFYGVYGDDVNFAAHISAHMRSDLFGIIRPSKVSDGNSFLSIFPHCLMLFTIDLSLSLSIHTYTNSSLMLAYIQRNAHIHREKRQSNQPFELSQLSSVHFPLKFERVFWSVFLIIHFVIS